ncbi:MAG: T9SS type A sorting domain-containing protein [candidate division Zixibacteria bacterium]|nr:T9SS type A sorting domain-containing protein [candidate division Zixibacteria bacterium]
MFKKTTTLFLSLLFICSFAYSEELPERYHTYQEVADTLAILGSLYPEAVYVDTMGYSQRDSLPMLRVKLSDNPAVDEDEPAVFLCGGVHADEVLSVEVTINFVYDYLANYAEHTPQVMNYWREMEVFVVPFINPEGHTVVEGGDLQWRKNKSDNDSNGVFDIHDGVDNNRNYDFGWEIDTDPSATTPESLMFKGFSPFSESENRAMREFGWKYRPLVAIDYHSPTYGRSEVAYYPWYWYPNQGGNGFSPDEQLMHNICDDFCGLIVNDAHDSTYEARRALVNKGDLKTYFYGNFGSIAFTVEISDTTIQDPEMIDDIVERHLPGQYYLLDRAMGPGITGVIRDSVTLEPIEAEVQVAQHINPDINPRLSRPDFGRYRRPLAPGTYTLTFIKEDYYSQTKNGISVGADEPTEVNVLLVPLFPRPPAPELLYPGYGDTVEVNIFELEWEDVELAENYLFEIAYDSLFDSLITADSTLEDPRYELMSPLENDIYYWRVRGHNENGWGPYCATSMFIVDTPTDIRDAETVPRDFILLQNYPNPFNASTVIAFEILEEGRVFLEVYNLRGRLIDTLFNGNLKPGRYSVEWDGSEYSSGVYMYRLKMNKYYDMKKMVLLK